MIASTWHDLLGTDIAGRYNLRSLVYAGRRQAEFQAVVADEGASPVSVALVEPEPSEAEQELAAIDRAKRLQHPNLLHVLDGGEYLLDDTPMLFIVTEGAERTLADAAAARELPKPGELLEDLLSALEWLHAQGLVYRSLDAETIVRAGGRWKLADLSQVHEIGRFEPVAAAGHGVPPEAASGIILPAWDSWSLGVLLQDTFGRKDADLPAPYAAIVRGCLAPDVEKRLSIDGIRKLLEPEPVFQPVAELPPAEDAHPTPRRLIAIVAAAVVLTAIVVALSWRPAGRKEPKLPPVVTRPVAKSAARELRPSPFTGEVQLAPPVQAPKKSVPLQTVPAVSSAPAKAKPAEAVQKTGRAEYLSDDLNGHVTATGEPFNNRALTAASRAYPLGSRLRVTNLKNGRSVTVRVNDRGASRHAIISVTRRAAEELGFVRDGSARVRIQRVK